MLTLEQIRFCAKEVERQGDGPIAVADMCAGYDYILSVKYPDHFLIVDINMLAAFVMPSTNGQFRTVPVTFNGVVGGADPEHIERQLELLLKYVTQFQPQRLDESKDDYDWSAIAEEFYQRFEQIHPFTDGNGRVGAILYNHLNGTLDHPVTPPEFKKG